MAKGEYVPPNQGPSSDGLPKHDSDERGRIGLLIDDNTIKHDEEKRSGEDNDLTPIPPTRGLTENHRRE